MVQMSQVLPLAVLSKGPSSGVGMKAMNQLGYGVRGSETGYVVSAPFLFKEALLHTFGMIDPECCDGSDENFSDSGVRCPNTCEETGKASRAAKEAENKIRRTVRTSHSIHSLLPMLTEFLIRAPKYARLTYLLRRMRGSVLLHRSLN